ncbi:platelet glycoprotein Ib alpha chain [Podarcis raffonei]|uniref:platelet glycoprotein Ib alpha chain n=1 Tax=Podarcis raffonei TaxID=65483 RepID=UPI0023291605|nr:platelet glycoprotein Ib alpha chain [Podarcis raffonei]
MPSSLSASPAMLPRALRVLLATLVAAAGAPDAAPPCESEMNKIKDLLQVSCVGQGLSSVPAGLPTDTGILLLGSNRLSRVSLASFQHLSALVELDLSNNSLSALDTGGASLPGLQQLDLSHNGLQSLPVLQGMPALKRLALAHNALSRLPAGGFGALRALEDLELQGNGIRDLPEGAFEGLQKLRDVDLADNLLEELPGGLLAGLGSLEILRLERNRLQRVPDGFFPEENYFAYLYLAENPWVCDCALVYLRDYILEYETSVYTRVQGPGKEITENKPESVECQAPAPEKGRPVMHFQAHCEAPEGDSDGGQGEGGATTTELHAIAHTTLLSSTAAPATRVRTPPSTAAPTTRVRTTPSTAAPTTRVRTPPSTAAPTTRVRTPPSTAAPTTRVRTPPSTAAPTTRVRTTPSTAAPTTRVRTPPSTAAPTTRVRTPPSTAAPTTRVRTTPSTAAPTTRVRTTPSTAAPTTRVRTPPSTAAPTTRVRTTPSTAAPTTRVRTTPSTASPTTRVRTLPSTAAPTTRVRTPPSTAAPTTRVATLALSTTAPSSHVPTTAPRNLPGPVLASTPEPVPSTSRMLPASTLQALPSMMAATSHPLPSAAASPALPPLSTPAPSRCPPPAPCHCSLLPATAPQRSWHWSPRTWAGWLAAHCCLLRLVLYAACLALAVLPTLALLCWLGWLCASLQRPALRGGPGPRLVKYRQLQKMGAPRGWQLERPQAQSPLAMPRTYRVCKVFEAAPSRHVSWLFVSLPGPTQKWPWQRRRGRAPSAYSLDRGQDAIGAVRVSHGTATL